ncbi:hypothetical protein [Mycobacterium intracellulare]|uniref:Uncharacterized protein n=1 Tax=Mycobacterium intracellulare subsp. chimaera TaxID=222805 RepID=A0ABT7P3W7_MYCIT|nr:hypothetical protein [Mycobacterium intracellulare]MDM3927791.1 hypothetical protein [Mycobacterium intracellulare subsp. chimaera]
MTTRTSQSHCRRVSFNAHPDSSGISERHALARPDEGLPLAVGRRPAPGALRPMGVTARRHARHQPWAAMNSLLAVSIAALRAAVRQQRSDMLRSTAMDACNGFRA